MEALNWNFLAHFLSSWGNQYWLNVWNCKLKFSRKENLLSILKKGFGMIGVDKGLFVAFSLGSHLRAEFFLVFFLVHAGEKPKHYASVNSTCAQPTPPPSPSNRGAFASLVSPGGGALTNLARPEGQVLAKPRGHPRAFDTHVVNFKAWSTWRISEIKISSLWRIGLSSKG